VSEIDGDRVFSPHRDRIVGSHRRPGRRAHREDAGCKELKVSRTPWGHPDLQGIWNNGTTTPLERPKDLENREFLTDEEWAARAKEVATPRREAA